MTNDMKILANTTTTVCILKMYVATTKKMANRTANKNARSATDTTHDAY